VKVIINVWLPDKPHDPLDGMPKDTILEYDGFKYPEVEAHGVKIERCHLDNLPCDCLKVFLDEYPARIDADPTFQTIHLLDKSGAEYYSEAYTILSKDKGKRGEIK
jgi:hypothetical protein